MATPSILKRRDAIIEQALPDVIFDGWRWKTIESAAARSGKSEDARALFPGGLSDALDGFSDWADRRMLEKLSAHDPEKMRVRDRIRMAVLARLEILAPYKEAEKLALVYWAMPIRAARAAKIAWRTADRIWSWAGDMATDYNHYTKRGLLSGVLAATMLAWLDDESADLRITRAFLDRRIENVMQLGGAIGKLKPKQRAAS